MKPMLLNNLEHRDLRISTRQAAHYGDNVHYALVVPSELRTAQNFYPLFIQKDSNTGNFFFSAILGFQEGENLFLDDTGWNAEYIPMSIMRQPFLIGRQSRVENGEQKVNRVIHIDMDSPRINAEDGERLFTELGESTLYLQSIADMLESLHLGMLEANQLMERLLAYNLLEPVALKITFNAHKKYELADLYTINEDILRKLPDNDVISLYREGALEKVYSILHSQSRVSSLIRLKNIQDLA